MRIVAIKVGIEAIYPGIFSSWTIQIWTAATTTDSFAVALLRRSMPYKRNQPQ
jgi:hypothetical protein